MIVTSKRILIGSLVISSFLATQTIVSAQQSSPTLDRLRSTKTIRIAYRPDAPPFSFKSSLNEPTGYIVELCKAVAAQIGQQLNVSLSPVYVPVSSVDRFDAIRQGKADMLCEATSATLSRRETMDFSIDTYIDGASLMVKGNGPQTLQGFAGQKIGVLAGTTTEQALRDTLKAANISATVVLAKTHAEGLAMLDAGSITGYFADRGILQALQLQSKTPLQLGIADNYLTIEPYALALPFGDEGFRLAVDTALSHIYRSGQVFQIFNQSFGGQAKPGQVLQTLYLIAGYPN